VLKVSSDVRRALAIVAAVLAAATAIGMLVIGFGTDVEPTVENVLAGEVYEARVVATEVAACSGTGVDVEDAPECVIVELELTQGPDRGETRTLEFPTDSPSTPDLGAGDRIVVNRAPDAEPGFDYSYADRQRRRPVFMLAVLFAVAVVLLGRLRGLAALVGLVASMGVILVFILPAILEGHSPVVVAVLGASAIAFIALYLAHGFNSLTTVALLGTLAALALTIFLSVVFTGLTELSGFASEEAATLGLLAADVDIRGLVLAGIVIGALGALDDMTVTQAAAVAELREANPSMTRRQLYAAGLRIGRDHIASTVNTLALAYAGAALPVLLLFVLSQQSLGAVANGEVVAVEIVRTLVGSIGLVVSVPVTTWLAAVVVGAHTGAPPPGPTRRARRGRPPAPATAPDRDRTTGAGAGEGDDYSFWQ
jgi:uncharacterized membrane protein